jgi:hypothetical protein
MALNGTGVMELSEEKGPFEITGSTVLLGKGTITGSYDSWVSIRVGYRASVKLQSANFHGSVGWDIAGGELTVDGNGMFSPSSVNIRILGGKGKISLEQDLYSTKTTVSHIDRDTSLPHTIASWSAIGSQKCQDVLNLGKFAFEHSLDEILNFECADDNSVAVNVKNGVTWPRLNLPQGLELSGTIELERYFVDGGLLVSGQGTIKGKSDSPAHFSSLNIDIGSEVTAENVAIQKLGLWGRIKLGSGCHVERIPIINFGDRQPQIDVSGLSCDELLDIELGWELIGVVDLNDRTKFTLITGIRNDCGSQVCKLTAKNAARNFFRVFLKKLCLIESSFGPVSLLCLGYERVLP